MRMVWHVSHLNRKPDIVPAHDFSEMELAFRPKFDFL